MSDTPRTDAVVWRFEDGAVHRFNTVPVDWAHELERENTALRAELEKVKGDLQAMTDARDDARKTNSVAIERDALRHQLRTRNEQLIQREVELAATTDADACESNNPQPDYSDIWKAFVSGAREAHANPTAAEKDFNRAADCYCKLLHSEKAPVMFAALGSKRQEALDWETPV